MRFFPLTNYRNHQDFRFELRTGISTYGTVRELCLEAKCQRSFKLDHVAQVIGERIAKHKNIGSPISIADLHGRFYVADGRHRIKNEMIPNETPCRVDIYTVSSHEQIRELFFDLNNGRAMSRSMICFTSPKLFNVLSEVARISVLAGAWAEVDREDTSLTMNKENYYNLLKYVMAFVKNTPFHQKPMECIDDFKKDIQEGTSAFSKHMAKLATMAHLVDVKFSYLLYKPTIRIAWAASHKKIGNKNVSEYFRNEFLKDYKKLERKDEAPRNQVRAWVETFSTL
jgi:hypothetical protein